MHDNKGTALDGIIPATEASDGFEYSKTSSLPTLSSYRAKRLSLKKRPKQAPTSTLPLQGKAAGSQVSENGSLNGLGSAFTAPRRACFQGMPSQQEPLLTGLSQASSASAPTQPLSILSSKQPQPQAAGRMGTAVAGAADMSETLDGSARPAAGQLEQPLGFLSSKQAESGAPARPAVPVGSASMLRANDSSAIPAAGQSWHTLSFLLSKQAEPEAAARLVSIAAGTCESSGGCAKPTAVCVDSRQPLQGWVPRKRNLASFDALDDLPDLSRLGQQRAAQKLLASMPFKAPSRRPGLQKAPGERVNCFPESLSAMPAASAQLIPKLEGGAWSSIVADGSAASQPAGSVAPGRRLQCRKPITAPMPVERVEHGAPADASDKPASKVPGSIPPEKRSESSATGAASAALASPAGSGPFYGSICIGADGLQCKGSALQAGSASEAGALAASSVGLESLPIVEDTLPASEGAEIALLGDDCANTLQHSFHRKGRIRSESKQQQQQDSMAGGTDSHIRSGACLDASRSGADEDATPACAAGADWVGQRSSRTQSVGRKRLKRLYDDTLADPACSDNPRHASQDEDADLLADIGVLSAPRPSHLADASQASVPQASHLANASKASIPRQAPAPVPGCSAKPALQPISDSEDDSWSDDLDALDGADVNVDSQAPAWNDRTRWSLKRPCRASEAAAAAAADRDEPDWDAGAGPTAGLPQQVSRLKSAFRQSHRANPFLSSKAALHQEPILACHAAPAQPQSDMQNDGLSCGDMQALLTMMKPQAAASRSACAEPDVAAADIIDLASEGSGDEGACARPPVGAQKKLIRLPAMPATGPTSQRRGTPQRRAYLGAYSSADVLAEPAQLSTAAAPQHQTWRTPEQPHSDQVASQDWLEQGGSRWHEDAGAAAGYEQLFAPRSANAQRSVEAQGAQCTDAAASEAGPNRQPAGAAAWEAGPDWQHAAAAAQELGPGGQCAGGAAAHEAGPSGQLGMPRNGPPWWHRLNDFVPVASLRHGKDPRDSSIVHINYAAQFSGEKQLAAAGGGFKQASRDCAGAEGSGEGALSIVRRTAKAKSGRRGKAYVGRKKSTGNGSGGWPRFKRKH